MKSLMPNYCLCCNDRSYRDVPLCAGCQHDLPLILHGCQYCNQPLKDPKAELCGNCSHQTTWHDGIIAPYLYAPPISDWICQYKYNGKDYLRYLLAYLLCQNAKLISNIDYLVPIPLHTKKLKQRGYNQSALLSHQISRHTAIPVLDTLVKTKQTLPQANLNAQQRQTNINNVFACKGELKDKCILIIDDVVTTGSTIKEAAKTLKKSGAKYVYAWAVATGSNIRK